MNPYDLHSWSKQYREEALREARDLTRSGGPSDGARSSVALAIRIWSSMLALLGRPQLVK